MLPARPPNESTHDVPGDRRTAGFQSRLCPLCAVGMILELEQGFGGLIHISPQPMRQAVEVLEARLTGDESP